MNLFEVAVAFFVIFSNFVVILFQKVTFPMKLSIRRLLLSNSVPLQLSKCSCDSCASVSHNLQVRFSFQDFLAFIFTFANDLARYLKYTRLFAMDNVWRYCLSLGLSSILSATFLLDFIQLASHPAMGGIGGANIAFKLYEAQIIPALLHNCESWISLDDSHIKLLQEFQEKFVRRLLWLHSKIPKVLLEYDTGLEPMKWRIAYRKLNFVRKIMAKPEENMTVHQIPSLTTSKRQDEC